MWFIKRENIEQNEANFDLWDQINVSSCMCLIPKKRSYYYLTNTSLTRLANKQDIPQELTKNGHWWITDTQRTTKSEYFDKVKLRKID